MAAADQLRSTEWYQGCLERQLGAFHLSHFKPANIRGRWGLLKRMACGLKCAFSQLIDIALGERQNILRKPAEACRAASCCTSSPRRMPYGGASSVHRSRVIGKKAFEDRLNESWLHLLWRTTKEVDSRPSENGGRGHRARRFWRSGERLVRSLQRSDLSRLRATSAGAYGGHAVFGVGSVASAIGGTPITAMPA